MVGFLETGEDGGGGDGGGGGFELAITWEWGEDDAGEEVDGFGVLLVANALSLVSGAGDHLVHRDNSIWRGKNRISRSLKGEVRQEAQPGTNIGSRST